MSVRRLLNRLSAVWAFGFVTGKDETTILACSGLGIPERCATGQAARAAYRIASGAVSAGRATKSGGDVARGAECPHRFFDGLPHLFVEVKVFDILGDVIQPAQQIQRVASDGQECGAQAGGNPQPGLLTQVNDDPIFMVLNRDAERRSSAGLRVLAAGDLYDCLAIDASLSGYKIAAVKTTKQDFRQVG